MGILANASGQRAARLAMRFVAASVLAAATAAAMADTIYVSPVGDDANAGTPAAPKATIQAGINAAGSGGVVVLAQGNYAGAGNTALDLGVVLAGGSIAIQSTDGKPSCVIDCGRQRLINVPDGAQISVTLAGLTVQNGEATAADGGAVYIGTNASATFTNCTFRDNHVISTAGRTADGGAVRVWGAGTFTDCRFFGNRADVSAPDQSANAGAVAAANVAFTRCTFESNRAWGGGGALFLRVNCSVTDCRFAGNSAYAGGAVEQIGSVGSRIDYDRCTFTANRASTGAAIMALGVISTITNSLFASNALQDTPADMSSAVPARGGAIIVLPGSLVSVVGCTIADTTSAITDSFVRPRTGLVSSAGTGSLRVTNCIIRVRSGEQATAGLVTPTYSDLTGGGSGTGDIDADPQFVNPAGGDYHLRPTSPCIDTADNTATSGGGLDLDGHPRTFGAGRDMGAYELFVSKATDQFTITRSAWSYDRTSGNYSQTVAVTNAGANIATPVYLVFSGVTGGTVTNASGTTQNTPPTGLPYVTLAAGGLAHGFSASFTVTIHATSGPIGYTPYLYTGSGTP